jgi:hypothetical protein
MNGSVLLVAVLLVTAGVLYILRRIEPLAALLAAGISALLAMALWRLPLTTVRLAGRTVELGQSAVWQELSFQLSLASRPLLVFLLGTAALTFILAWRTYQGRTFYPLGLALVALWGIVALVRPLIYAPLALVLVAILAVFVIQAGRPGDTRGAWRQLVFPVLAVPLFVVAAWYLEQGPLNPDDQTPYQIAGWLLIAGFILLLQPAPLHIAMPSVAGSAPPVVAVFLWIGGQATALFLLQRFLVSYPWLGSTIVCARWLLWLGMFTALFSGLLAATRQRWGADRPRLLFDYGSCWSPWGCGAPPVANRDLAAADPDPGHVDRGLRRRCHPPQPGRRRLRTNRRCSVATAVGGLGPDHGGLCSRGYASYGAVRLALGAAATGC